MVDVAAVPTDDLGDRSYIADDGRLAIVVNLQRDLDRLQAVLDKHGLSCAMAVGDACAQRLRLRPPAASPPARYAAPTTSRSTARPSQTVTDYPSGIRRYGLWPPRAHRHPPDVWYHRR